MFAQHNDSRDPVKTVSFTLRAAIKEEVNISLTYTWHLSVLGKFDPTVALCLNAFELSVAWQRRFNDCSAVFMEVNKVDISSNCCFSTWGKSDGDVQST